MPALITITLWNIRRWGMIPQNFIVGPDGKIVARDLHGADLEKKLSEIYK
jgi:hypothetical protein